MLSLLCPNISDLHSSLRISLDLFSGFVLVYIFRLVFTSYHRSSLIRKSRAAITGPVLALRDVPGPTPPSWLWGSEWEMYSAEPGQKYLEWYNRFGRIVKYKGILGSTFLSLADPLAIQYIMGHQHSYAFTKPDGERQFFLTLLGRGIIWAEGQAHAHQRKILGPAFTHQALRSLFPIFFDSAYKTAQGWSAAIDAVPGESVEIDVMKWANHLSLDTIGLAGFAYDFETLNTSKPQHPLARTLDGLTDSSGTHSFSAFLVHAVLWTFPAILRIPSKRQEALAKSRQMLGKLTEQVLRERKGGFDCQNAGKSILEQLLRAELAGTGNQLGQQEIAAEIMSLIFAGYETTATLIAWVLQELALNPAHQERLRNEVSATPSDPSFDDLHSGLPFLDAVINETLRIHPPVLQIHREATEDSLIPLTPLPKGSSCHAKQQLSPSPSTHLFVPRGTIILLPVNVMQRAEDVWGPEGHVWDPRRWTEIEANEAEEKGRDWRRELLAFSAGTRICIGRSFALLEAKTIIASLVRQFSFAPAEGKEIEPLLSFVVRPRVKGDHKSSLPLNVSKVMY